MWRRHWWTCVSLHVWPHATSASSSLHAMVVWLHVHLLLHAHHPRQRRHGSLHSGTAEPQSGHRRQGAASLGSQRRRRPHSRVVVQARRVERRRRHVVAHPAEVVAHLEHRSLLMMLLLLLLPAVGAVAHLGDADLRRDVAIGERQLLLLLLMMMVVLVPDARRQVGVVHLDGHDVLVDGDVAGVLVHRDLRRQQQLVRHDCGKTCFRDEETQN